MSDDDKPVPEPGEARRDDDELHYHEIDETNVDGHDRPSKPPADDTPRPQADES